MEDIHRHCRMYKRQFIADIFAELTSVERTGTSSILQSWRISDSAKKTARAIGTEEIKSGLKYV